jgi:hypothetical protein
MAMVPEATELLHSAPRGRRWGGLGRQGWIMTVITVSGIYTSATVYGPRQGTATHCGQQVVWGTPSSGSRGF